MSQNIINSSFYILLIILFINSSHCQYSKSESFDLPNSICLNNKKTYITTYANEQTLLAYFSFDEITPQDSSGKGNEAEGEIGVGPSALIKGNSAYFNGTQILTLKLNSESMKNIKGDLSVTFWIYLLEDSTGNWRTILHKGSTIQDLTPTIMLWPNERRLHVRAGSDNVWNDGFESKGTINLRQWTHIALVISGQMMQLYINGNLDNQIILKGKVKMNKGDFHLGKDQWHAGVKCYIDEFKVYSRAIERRFIEADSVIGNPQLGNSYVKLGCDECTFVQALSSCVEGYHMCSYDELYSGAYLVARRNGWFQFKSDIWGRQTEAELDKEAYLNEIGDPSVKKMTLCCKNN